MLKVLFIHDMDLMSEVETRYPPLWPSYLAAYCNKFLGGGHVQFRFMRGPLSQELDTYEPDLVGISAVSQNFNYALRLSEECKKRRIASFVIGSPDETEADIMETYHFVRTSRLDFVDIYVLTPLPGTPVWDFAVAHGLVSSIMDWSRLDINFEHSWRRVVLVSQALTRSDILRLYRKFRRLRLYKIARALPGSPWLADLPRMVAALIAEKIYRLSIWSRLRHFIRVLAGSPYE